MENPFSEIARGPDSPDIEMTPMGASPVISVSVARKLLSAVSSSIDGDELALIAKDLSSGLQKDDAAVSEGYVSIADRRARLQKLADKVNAIASGSPFSALSELGFSSSHSEKGDSFQLSRGSVLLFTGQLAVTILWYLFGDYSIAPVDSLYTMYVGISSMMLIGFAYLMTFLRRYGFGALGFTLLLTCFMVEWVILCMGFFEKAHEGHWSNIELSVRWLIEGNFGAATFLISFGALIGKVDSSQLFVIAFLESIFYSLNYYICALQLQSIDVGGSMYIHTFGGLFGLAVSWVMSKPSHADHKDNRSRYTSDLLAFLGTVSLWLFWPSFNAAPAKSRQSVAIINTVFSLCSSTIATFLFSRTFRSHRKIEMVDVCNAVLAGGVAVGSTADLNIGPGGAMVIGFASGSVSTLLFIYGPALLRKHLGLVDTCSVHALHAVPGIMGGLASIFAALRAAGDHSLYNGTFSDVFPRGDDQAKYQLASLAITIGISIVSGLLVGCFVKGAVPQKIAEHDMYSDDIEFTVEDSEYRLLAMQDRMVSAFKQHDC
eukprot:ANDGO_04213.mRNA.1 Rhesus-like glycoprotein B